MYNRSSSSLVNTSHESILQFTSQVQILHVGKRGRICSATQASLSYLSGEGYRCNVKRGSRTLISALYCILPLTSQLPNTTTFVPISYLSPFQSQQLNMARKLSTALTSRKERIARTTHTDDYALCESTQLLSLNDEPRAGQLLPGPGSRRASVESTNPAHVAGGMTKLGKSLHVLAR